MNELISIIIPIYNISQYLHRCIDSVCNQTYRNLQIILVDDGSTDESAKICDQYANIDDRIQVIHKPNGGLVSARKSGLRAATGKYVGYVDGDDWIEPDMYERMVREMETLSVDMVETDAYMDMGDESVFMSNRLTYGIYNTDAVIPQMLCDEEFNICPLKAYVWSKLFRKDLLENVQYLVDDIISFGEDVAVTYPYILQCGKISVIDYAGYHYVQRQGSMVHTINSAEWKNNEALIKCLHGCFRVSNNKDILLPQLNQYTKLLFLLRHIDYFDKDENSKVLIPFGGINCGKQVIVYGAGRIGQSVYNYLNGLGDVDVVCWLDREYEKYQQIGLNVESPDIIVNEKCKNAIIVIAVNSKRAVSGIRSWLMKNGVMESSVLWLTDEFIKYDLLNSIT